LYWMVIRNAISYGVNGERLIEFREVTHQLLANMFDPRKGLLRKPLQDGERLRDRHARIISEYSRWVHPATRSIGPSATSLQYTGPQAPVGRILTAITAATYIGNLANHLHAAATGTAWLAIATYTLYSVADLLLIAPVLPSAVSGWFAFNI